MTTKEFFDKMSDEELIAYVGKELSDTKQKLTIAVETLEATRQTLDALYDQFKLDTGKKEGAVVHCLSKIDETLKLLEVE